MQALVSQLEAKDRQIAALNERLKESNINLNVAMQKLQLQQHNSKEEQERLHHKRNRNKGNHLKRYP